MAKRLGELLIEAQVITPAQLEQALAAQQQTEGKKLGHVLIELQFVTETQLTQTLSRQLSVPWVSLYHITFSRSLLNYVPREVAEKYALVPIFVRKVRKQGETLYVAMDDPTNEAALAEVQSSAAVPVRPMIACPSDIRSAIRVYYGGDVSVPAAPPSRASLPSYPESSPRIVPAPPPSSPVVASRVPSASGREPTRPDREMRPRFPSSESIEDAPTTVPAATITEADHPGSDPEIEATEMTPKPRAKGGRMVALTLLDGTTISLPATKKKSASRPDAEEEQKPPGDQLTARDFISALRAVTHGADASEILGDRPPSWEAMFATLLSLLLKKGLIADWEFVEEYRKI